MIRRFGLLFLLFALVLSAKEKPKNWQDSVFLGVRAENGGSATLPVGNATVSVPIKSVAYWFRSGGLIYVLKSQYVGNHPPILTVNGHTNIAVEGENVYVVDDTNHYYKFRLIGKIAPPSQ